MQETAKNSILIVDDEPLNLSALSHILSSEYTIYIEKDGQGCIDAANELKPDLILLDVMMPAMTGFEAIAVLKKDEATRNIPVVFVTGLGNAQDEEKGFCLGAADYIHKPFSSAIVKLRVRNQLKIINQLHHIHQLSITDVLTEVHNRRHFNNIINQEWRRAIRAQKPIGFIIYDIDNFKDYNDTHGHLQGDIVLKGVAQIINTHLKRPADHLARWGGEEFAVILPETDLRGATMLANEIRKAVEETMFTSEEGESTRVTVSAGVNSIIPARDGLGSSLDNFVSETDKAMYHAKSSGRNTVCTTEEI